MRLPHLTPRSRPTAGTLLEGDMQRRTEHGQERRTRPARLGQCSSQSASQCQSVQCARAEESEGSDMTSSAGVEWCTEWPPWVVTVEYRLPRRSSAAELQCCSGGCAGAVWSAPLCKPSWSRVRFLKSAPSQGRCLRLAGMPASFTPNRMHLARTQHSSHQPTASSAKTVQDHDSRLSRTQAHHSPPP